MRLKNKHSQRGSNLIEFALLVTFVLVPLFLLTIDFGRAYYISIEVSDAARTAAQYGMAQPGASLTTIQNAATADVSADLTGMTAVAATGCMCSDGTSAQAPCGGTPPSCTGSVRLITYVQVNTSYTYTPIFKVPGLPASYVLKGLAFFPSGT